MKAVKSRFINSRIIFATALYLGSLNQVYAMQTVVHLYAPFEANAYGNFQSISSDNGREFGRLIFDDSLVNPAVTFQPLWSWLGGFGTTIGANRAYGQLLDENNKINLDNTGRLGLVAIGPSGIASGYEKVNTNFVHITSSEAFQPDDLSSDSKLGSINGWVQFWGEHSFQNEIRWDVLTRSADYGHGNTQPGLYQFPFGNGSWDEGRFGDVYGATIVERQLDAGQSASSAWFPQFVESNGGFGFLAGTGTLNITTINGQNAGQSLNRRGGFFDPEGAEGYTFETQDPGLKFESVMVPNAYGDGLFSLLIYDENSGQYQETGKSLRYGEWFDLTTLMITGVSKFRLMGIESYVDPTDPMGFVTGLTFLGDGDRFTMTAVTPVPVPAAGWLFGGGLLGLLRLRCRNDIIG